MESKWFYRNSVQYVIADSYAKAKGRFFGIFFGRKEDSADGITRFIFSHKDWQAIGEQIYYYETFVKGN